MVLIMNMLQQHRGTHHLSRLTILRLTETSLYYLSNVSLIHIVQVQLLNASHLIITEPIRCLGHFQLIQHLRIKLVVVNLACIVDEFTLRNRDTDVSTTTRWVSQRI